MQDLLVKLPEWLEIISQIGFGITILATIVVRITPSEKDNLSVEKAANKFLKFLSYLPTIGINPRTKKLEEAYLEIKSQQKK